MMSKITELIEQTTNKENVKTGFKEIKQSGFIRQTAELLKRTLDSEIKEGINNIVTVSVDKDILGNIIKKEILKKLK